MYFKSTMIAYFAFLLSVHARVHSHPSQDPGVQTLMKQDSDNENDGLSVYRRQPDTSHVYARGFDINTILPKIEEGAGTFLGALGRTGLMLKRHPGARMDLYGSLSARESGGYADDFELGARDGEVINPPLNIQMIQTIMEEARKGVKGKREATADADADSDASPEMGSDDELSSLLFARDIIGRNPIPKGRGSGKSFSSILQALGPEVLRNIPGTLDGIGDIIGSVKSAPQSAPQSQVASQGTIPPTQQQQQPQPPQGQTGQQQQARVRAEQDQQQQQPNQKRTPLVDPDAKFEDVWDLYIRDPETEAESELEDWQYDLLL